MKIYKIFIILIFVLLTGCKSGNINYNSNIDKFYVDQFGNIHILPR